MLALMKKYNDLQTDQPADGVLHQRLPAEVSRTVWREAAACPAAASPSLRA